MTKDIKELVRQLRLAREPIRHTAADALEALAGEVERWKKNHEALQDKIGCMKSCGCAYDAAGDICGHHSPKLIAAEAERDRLAGEVESLKQAVAAEKDEQARMEFHHMHALADLAAERDRFKTALNEIAGYADDRPGDWAAMHARKALGDAS